MTLNVRTWTAGEMVTRARLQTVADDLQTLYDNRWDTTNFSYSPKTVALASDQALSSSQADITGMSLTLDRIGTWIIIATFHLVTDPTDPCTVNLAMNVNGSNLASTLPDMLLASDREYMTSRQWLVTIGTQPQTAKCRGSRDIATTVKANNSKILAWCVKAP